MRPEKNIDTSLDAIVDRMKGGAATAAGGAESIARPPLARSSGAPAASTNVPPVTAAAANEALLKAIRMNEHTNEMGHSAITALGRQSETIQRSLQTVDETHMNLRDSRRSLREMKLQYWKDRLGKGLVILSLLTIIAIIVYVKWIRKFRT